MKAAGLFKYVWPFCYHQALKGWNVSVKEKDMSQFCKLK